MGFEQERSLSSFMLGMNLKSGTNQCSAIFFPKILSQLVGRNAGSSCCSLNKYLFANTRREFVSNKASLVDWLLWFPQFWLVCNKMVEGPKRDVLASVSLSNVTIKRLCLMTSRIINDGGRLLCFRHKMLADVFSVRFLDVFVKL